MYSAVDLGKIDFRCTPESTQWIAKLVQLMAIFVFLQKRILRLEAPFKSRCQDYVLLGYKQEYGGFLNFDVSVPLRRNFYERSYTSKSFLRILAIFHPPLVHSSASRTAASIWSMRSAGVSCPATNTPAINVGPCATSRTVTAAPPCCVPWEHMTFATENAVCPAGEHAGLVHAIVYTGIDCIDQWIGASDLSESGRLTKNSLVEGKSSTT